jgi:hypothetical protein
MHFIRAIIVEREMQPFDQAVTAFVVAVFVIFSAVMAYATYLDAGEGWVSSEKKKEK